MAVEIGSLEMGKRKFPRYKIHQLGLFYLSTFRIGTHLKARRQQEIERQETALAELYSV